MIKRIFTKLFLLVILISCSSDDDSPVLNIPNGNNGTVLEEGHKISSFRLTIDSEVFDGEIDQNDKTITFELVGADLSAIVPNIEYSPKATISPEEDVAQNFNEQISYTVYAENGDTSIYRVIINNRSLSGESKILDFSFTISDEVFSATINEELKEIEFDLTTADLSTITPQIEISQYATIAPNAAVSQDFNEIVYYTVKAENGNEVQYKVIANRPKIEVAGARYFGSRFVFSNEELRISGKFINPELENVKLYLTDGVNEYPLQILSSDSYDNNNKINYYLNVKMPSEISSYSDYKVVYKNNKFVAESEQLIDVLAENIPQITSLDKETYNVDDTVIITGSNLTDQLAIPNDGSLYLVDNYYSSIYNYELNPENTQIKFKLIRQVFGWSGPTERSITLLSRSEARVGPTVLTKFGS